jgi:hypothetical protein
MLQVVMLSVVIMSVIILNVVAPLKLFDLVEGGNPYLRGKLDTADLLIKLAYFVKKINHFKMSKAADLN